jgi:hypothetical protein
VGPKAEKVIRRGRLGGFRSVLGAKVDNAQEGSWSQCHEARLYLIAKALRVSPARRYLVLSL